MWSPRTVPRSAESEGLPCTQSMSIEGLGLETVSASDTIVADAGDGCLPLARRRAQSVDGALDQSGGDFTLLEVNGP